MRSNRPVPGYRRAIRIWIAALAIFVVGIALMIGYCATLA
jgi:hypothetical protein